jgi:mannosyltransferase
MKKVAYIYEPSISNGITVYQESLFVHLQKQIPSIKMVCYKQNDFTKAIQNKLLLNTGFLRRFPRLERFLIRLYLPFSLKRKFNCVIFPVQFSIFYNPYKIEVITVIHDLIALKKGTVDFFTNYVHRLLVPLSLKNSDKIVAISSIAKRDLINRGVKDSKITLIHNGVSPEFRNLNLQRKPFFMFFYQKVLTKNTDFTLNFFKKNRQYHAMVIGAEFPDEQNITYLGKVSNSELIRLYNTAQALIYLSSYEGFGMPIIEALRCKCPVITLESENMPDEVVSGTIKIQKKDFNELE